MSECNLPFSLPRGEGGGGIGKTRKQGQAFLANGVLARQSFAGDFGDAKAKSGILANSPHPNPLPEGEMISLLEGENPFAKVR